MPEQDVRLELYECASLLDFAHFNCCLGIEIKAKKQCLETIKILNRLSKTNTLQLEYHIIIDDLSSFTLKFYDSIEKKNKFTHSEKIVWLSSKLNEKFYPPRIAYSDKLDSFNSYLLPAHEVLRDIDDVLSIPESLNAHYKEVRIQNWSLDYNDLANLYQDLLTNCSFVSSLLSIVELNRNGILEDLIAPHLDVLVFKCQLYFNGSTRLITINNTLPFLDDTNRNLTINSVSNKNLYWPALVEKAYLKVLGSGYEFGGSNMAIDTFMLINWVPEIIPINNSKLNSCDKIWDYYLSRKVLLGLGTGKLSRELSKKLNLISGHDYLITSVDPIMHTIVLKNPWIENTNNYKRTLTMSIMDLHHFKYFYINWDPASFFKFKFQVTFIYNIKDQEGAQLYKKPQFSLLNTNEDSQDVWLLLEKHLPLKDSSEQLINIMIYETQFGEKVIVPNQYTRTNKDYSTNSRLMLLKFNMKPKQTYTIVISSTISNTFTLNMYNNISDDFKFNKAKFKYPNSLPTIHDKWTSKNSGGNWSLSSYIDSPQYDLELKESSANLLIGLYSEFEDKFVNFHIFQSNPNDKSLRIRLFDKSKLLFNEKYNMTYQFHEIKNLHPGFYKIVASAYDSNIEGAFELFTLHDSPPNNLSMTKIHTSLGLFLRKKQFNWNNSNRFKLYFETTQFNSHFTFHVKHYNHMNRDVESFSDYRPSIRASIFDAWNSQPIYINEEWNDSLYGLFIDSDIPKSGRYILLVERFEPGTGRCIVDIGCSRKFTIT